MFKSPAARYVLRAVLFGVSALLVALQADQSLADALIAAGLASLSYAGIGAAVPAVEPSIGRKLNP